MTEVTAVLILLAIVGAVVAVETPNLLHSVISVGTVGFLVAIAFLFLAAPDVAIVQIGVEVISLVILVRATIGRETAPETPHRAFVGLAVAVTLLLAIGLFGVHLLADLPTFGEPVMARLPATPSDVYLEEGLASTGAANIVTAVLLDYRGYDTLGEATVLFCAVLGALCVLRRRARHAAEPRRGGKGSS